MIQRVIDFIKWTSENDMGPLTTKMFCNALGMGREEVIKLLKTPEARRFITGLGRGNKRIWVTNLFGPYEPMFTADGVDLNALEEDKGIEQFDENNIRHNRY